MTETTIYKRVITIYSDKNEIDMHLDSAIKNLKLEFDQNKNKQDFLDNANKYKLTFEIIK